MIHTSSGSRSGGGLRAGTLGTFDSVVVAVAGCGPAYPMPYANVQRMQAHPMWEHWGSKVIETGAVTDNGDGPRIVVCLTEPSLLDQLEDYVGFLADLMPVQALHRIAFHRPQSGSQTVQ